MKTISTEDLKKLQINLLKEVDRVCTENNIDYWIDCGTLLGAIRHGGYIPWDDDIDVGMDRANYEKFRKIYNKQCNPRYKFVCYENDTTYLYPSGKVLDLSTVLYEPDRNGNKISVNIDVFVYDNAPDDDKKLKRQYDKRDLLRALHRQRVATYQLQGGLFKIIKGNFVRLILKLFPRDYFIRKMIENSQKYNFCDTKRVGNFTSYARIACNKDIISEYITLEFEGLKFKAMSRYDEWLTAFYHDYMRLPSEEKRVPHHVFEAFFIE